MGKTTLSVKLAQQVQSQFDYVIWRSLQQAPPLELVLSEILPILAGSEGLLKDMRGLSLLPGLAQTVSSLLVAVWIAPLNFGMSAQGDAIQLWRVTPMSFLRCSLPLSKLEMKTLQDSLLSVAA